MSHSNSVTSKDSGLAVDTGSSNHSSGASSSSTERTSASTNSLTQKFASFNFVGGSGGGGSGHGGSGKRAFSLPGRGGDKGKEGGGNKARDVSKNRGLAETGAATGDNEKRKKPSLSWKKRAAG